MGYYFGVLDKKISSFLMVLGNHLSSSFAWLPNSSSHLTLASQEETQNKDKISTKIEVLNEKTASLTKALAAWKSQLDEVHAFQQFNWKADVVESWIGMRFQRCSKYHLKNGL